MHTRVRAHAHTQKGSCRPMFRFLNLNRDLRKRLWLTKQIHFFILRPPPTPTICILRPGPFIGSLQHCLPGFPHIPNVWGPLMESNAILRRPEKPSSLDALVRILRLSTLRFDCKLKNHGRFFGGRELQPQVEVEP